MKIKTIEELHDERALELVRAMHREQPKRADEGERAYIERVVLPWMRRHGVLPELALGAQSRRDQRFELN
jgi:hypothetical protein